MAKKTLESDHLHLPDEIIEDILSRLAVKTLMRLRCVSKRWLSIIGSKGFIKVHLQNSPKPTTRPVLHRAFQKFCGIVVVQTSVHLLLDSPGEAMAGYVHKYNDSRLVGYSNTYNNPQVVGCCNGILCLRKDDGFHLWNPATRVYVKLPGAGFRVKNGHGFGYDETSDTYKVFAVVVDDKRPRPFARVYSSETNSWKTIAQEWDLNFYRDGRIKTGKFVCKKIHWLSPHRIDWFDVKNEVFGAIEFPFDQEKHRPVWLGEISGCLSLVYINGYRRETSCVCFWMMKEYGVKESWVEQEVMLDGYEYEYVRRHVLFDKEEGVVFEVYGSDGGSDDALSSMKIYETELVLEIDGMHFYVESLVSPLFDSSV